MKLLLLLAALAAGWFIWKGRPAAPEAKKAANAAERYAQNLGDSVTKAAKAADAMSDAASKSAKAAEKALEDAR